MKWMMDEVDTRHMEHIHQPFNPSCSRHHHVYGMPSLFTVILLFSSYLTGDVVAASFCLMGRERTMVKTPFSILPSTLTSVPVVPVMSLSRKRTHLHLYQEEPTGIPSSSSDKLYNKLSRREAFLLFIGGTAYAKLASDVIRKIQRGEAYPPEHEKRASDTFEVTLVTSFLSLLEQQRQQDEEGELGRGGEGKSRPLRVLEVGIGSSCRTFMRGTYDSAIERIIQNDEYGSRINGIHFVGVDIDIPKDQKILNDARSYLKTIGGKHGSAPFPINLDVQLADITKGLPFPDGYFDSITGSLVLCSVEDQRQALNEIKRLLNPDVGTFGYIEHVAVNLQNESEKDLRFLDWQQQAFDPLQQILAHNCHLHRNTDSLIREVFMSPSTDGGGEVLLNERFQVKEMWPVSCQSRGVIQMKRL